MRKSVAYIFLVLVVFGLDRITKFFALAYCKASCAVLPFLSFELVFNRGISWGIANTPHSGVFLAVTLIIIAVTVLLAHYAYCRFQSGNAIYGELLVLVGSVSNILDRLVYGGVIDFILFYYGRYTFPIFNLADVAIVCGVGIMFMQLVENKP